MKKEKNMLWRFFASVKLALFTLFILAITSIIGTVIPQNKPAELYVQQFGANTARLFEMLNIDDMYNSWWFVTLLVVFSLNLIVCSLERLPNVFRIMKQDNLATDRSRLEKSPNRALYFTSAAPATVASGLAGVLGKAGWKTEAKEGGGSALLFSQKGSWTRLGVYFVHVSILIIFAGAIIGAIFGHKGSVMIPEGSLTDKIYQYDENNTPIPLGFEVRCDKFSLTYYDNGMPREFRSDLVILKNGQEVLKRPIIVNDPLDYEGYTFYQSSYQAMENNFLVRIKNQATGEEQIFNIPPRRKAAWQEEEVQFGIVTLARSQNYGKYRFKIWFGDNKGAPAEFWVDEETPANIERPDATYVFTIKQRFATGLQVAKDPGVWTVYIGCMLMLFGLYAAFFLSHRRIWVYIDSEGDRTRVLLSGSANKNKLGFDKNFAALDDLLKKNEQVTLTGE